MIQVQDSRFGRGVCAVRRIEPGEVVLQGWGEVTTHRSRHSIQFDDGQHVLIRSEIELINHSCAPNCGFLLQRGVPWLEVHAMRTIEPGEEITVDYASFEDDIHHLGPCLCGEPSCRGSVTGYRHLPEDRREAYGPYVAEYLREAQVEAALAS